MARAREVRVIDELGEPADDLGEFTYSITSYGADYTIDGLVKRMREGDIYVPSFQRGFVWSLRQASRFVESLLLGLPVPGIFLSREEETQKHLVIDGQQRLRSLQYFYEGVFPKTGRVFSLKKVQHKFDGATYKQLPPEDRRRLHDSILHATVVRQDVPSDDKSSIYHIFARLNTGGTQLQPQEIRTALYHGPFSDLLRELNQSKAWRAIYGPVSLRMRDQELILRFLALFFYDSSYARPMATFLNRYMGQNRELQLKSRDSVRSAFETAIGLVYEALGTTAFKPRRALNAAVFDGVMVGIARALAQRKPLGAKDVGKRYKALLVDEDFLRASSKATADEENVKRRLRLASTVFAGK